MKMLILAISFMLAMPSLALAQDKAEDSAKAAVPAAATTAIKQPSEIRKSQHERVQQRMIFCNKEADEKKLDGGRRKNYINSWVKK
jgi:type II secretory pathway pseudopilin PulG